MGDLPEIPPRLKPLLGRRVTVREVLLTLMFLCWLVSTLAAARIWWHFDDLLETGVRAAQARTDKAIDDYNKRLKDHGELIDQWTERLRRLEKESKLVLDTLAAREIQVEQDGKPVASIDAPRAEELLALPTRVRDLESASRAICGRWYAIGRNIDPNTPVATISSSPQDRTDQFSIKFEKGHKNAGGSLSATWVTPNTFEIDRYEGDGSAMRVTSLGRLLIFHRYEAERGPVEIWVRP